MEVRYWSQDVFKCSQGTKSPSHHNLPPHTHPTHHIQPPTTHIHTNLIHTLPYTHTPTSHNWWLTSPTPTPPLFTVAILHIGVSPTSPSSPPTKVSRYSWPLPAPMPLVQSWTSWGPSWAYGRSTFVPITTVTWPFSGSSLSLLDRTISWLTPTLIPHTGPMTWVASCTMHWTHTPGTGPTQWSWRWLTRVWLGRGLGWAAWMSWR